MIENHFLAEDSLMIEQSETANDYKLSAEIEDVFKGFNNLPSISAESKRMTCSLPRVLVLAGTS
jgi:hypothetical protein